MDDLAGMQWSSTAPNQKKPPLNAPSAFSTLRPSPSPFTSGRNTPLSAQSSGPRQTLKAAATPIPVQDAFSNLMSIGKGPSSSKSKLSLAERQQQLEAERRRKLQDGHKQASAGYGDGQSWDRLGTGSSGVSRTTSPAIPLAKFSSPLSSSLQGNGNGEDDDLFAAFNKDTKVDNASYYPPPTTASSARSTPGNGGRLDLSTPGAWRLPNNSDGANNLPVDDDDPFGLNEFAARSTTSARVPVAQSSAPVDEDDFLGDLGKPVEQVRRQPRRVMKAEPGKPIEDLDEDSSSEDNELPRPTGDDPFDKAVAQIMEMGFSADDARRGLTESGEALNVQAAIGWLLKDAHRKAKEKTQGRSTPSESDHNSSSRQRPVPVSGPESKPNRTASRSPIDGEVDLAHTAAAVGTSLFKTANKFWSAGQKKVQKAVAEFQQDGGESNSQPKWMREAQQASQNPESRATTKNSDVTDEAMLLETGTRPQRSQDKGSSGGTESSRTSSREQSPAMTDRPVKAAANRAPAWQASQPSLLNPRARLSKEAIEEQSSQAYISPARRRKTTPQPDPVPASKEVDIYGGDTLLSGTSTSAHSSAQAPPQAKSVPSRPQPPKARPTPNLQTRPARQIPSITPVALQTSHRHRAEGTAHFKRGDYASAHASYSSALAAIPQTHPIAIILLSNRSLTALKTGDPRQAMLDADAAITLIGPTKGADEQVQLQDGTNENKDMRELYGKALTRKAEALEQMEKWSEAGAVWQEAVESGVGGQTATTGRQRCQKALAPKSATKPPAPTGQRRTTAATTTGPSSSRPKTTPARTVSNKDFEAVTRLQAANEAAEKADNEKFALSDQVDAKIAAWRDGKRDNLRALLGSLDNVLWPDSGWKKVGLHELVVAKKVKVVYMRAIGKTHPDKLPQDASTEVRMVAATVFATLNESWDKFKTENGL